MKFLHVDEPRASKMVSKLTKSSSRFIFILQGVARFICDGTEGQHRFLVAPCSLAIPTSSQSNVFFLFACTGGQRPCCEVLTSKASKDATKSLDINTLERMCIKAVFNGFPSFTPSPKMSISIGTQSSSCVQCNQVFCLDSSGENL